MRDDNQNNPFMNRPDIEWFEMLHPGKWANANVYRFQREGKKFVRKGFCLRSFLVRWTIGLLLTHREAIILRKLAGIRGIPEQAKRCCAFCLRYRYLEGESLGSVSNRREKLPSSYFLEAEKLLDQMHKRKIVHLDLRRGDNWLVLQDGTPGIIDFQSAFSVAWLPKSVQEKLHAIDHSGIYKFWERLGEEPLDPNRKAQLDQVNRTRKLWVFKGYGLRKLLHKRKPIKKKTQASG